MLFAQLPPVEITGETVSATAAVCAGIVYLLVVLNERARLRVQRAGRLETAAR